MSILPHPSPYFLLSCAAAQITPFDRFLWLMAQKTCFRVVYVLFGEQKIIFPLFSAKMRNSIFPQFLLQLAITPVITEDRAVKFA